MRLNNSVLEVMLITSRKRMRWSIPKGMIEPGMTARESAEKEAFEEAGIKGVVSDYAIGRYQYAKWEGICQVEVFLFLVSQVYHDWPEYGVRNRQWLPYDEAAKLVEEQDLRKLIEQLPVILQKGGQHGFQKG
jgi:8-oxo-dGTP pyrophosphatase MutT (NUDIX family)